MSDFISKSHVLISEDSSRDPEDIAIPFPKNQMLSPCFLKYDDYLSKPYQKTRPVFHQKGYTIETVGMIQKIPKLKSNLSFFSYLYTR